MQVHAWTLDMHLWAQADPDFFSSLVLEVLRRENLLVRPPLLCRRCVGASFGAALCCGTPCALVHWTLQCRLL